MWVDGRKEGRLGGEWGSGRKRGGWGEVGGGNGGKDVNRT